MIYVLHHVGKPSLYHGLPRNPSISRTIELWKGSLRPSATFGIAVATLADYFYYITVGPNHTIEDGGEPGAISKDGGTLPCEEDTQ